jgi:hypothetical protein
MPTNMGALLQAAQDIASDDVHVAVGSRCDEKQGLCGAEGETYEHHAIDGNGDPLEQAADLVAQVTNTRPFVPRHVYVLTTIDTAWSEVDLLADPDLAGAHLHVRLSGEPCDGAPQLEALAEASGGSFVCDDFVGVEVLGPELRMAQPSCEVFGNAARGPTPRMPATELTLQGEAPSGAEAIELGAAAACQNQPDAWTFIDAVVGHVGLCPVTCRDAGAWAPPTLSATVTFTCE